MFCLLKCSGSEGLVWLIRESHFNHWAFIHSQAVAKPLPHFLLMGCRYALGAIEVFKYSSSWESESDLLSFLCVPERSSVLVKTLSSDDNCCDTKATTQSVKTKRVCYCCMSVKLLEQYCIKVLFYPLE